MDVVKISKNVGRVFTKHAFYKTFGKAFDDKLNANELIKSAIDNKVLIQIGDDAFVINPFIK